MCLHNLLGPSLWTQFFLLDIVSSEPRGYGQGPRVEFIAPPVGSTEAAVSALCR